MNIPFVVLLWLLYGQRFSVRVRLGLGNGFFVRSDFFAIRMLNARLAFKLALQLTLGLGPLFLLTCLFLLAFGKSCAWSRGQWLSPLRRAAASFLN
jgi:hypothetical protein